MSPLTLRHKLRPPRSVFFPPAKTRLRGRPCRHELRHRLSVGVGRNMPSASSSLASSGISHTRTYFVHNLYTKNRTAENSAPNLHPRWQHAGTQNTAKKLWRDSSPLKPPHIPEVQQHSFLHPGTSQITHKLPLVCSIQRRNSLQL